MIKDFYNEARAIASMTDAINRKIKYDSEYKVIESKRGLRDKMECDNSNPSKDERNKDVNDCIIDSRSHAITSSSSSLQ